MPVRSPREDEQIIRVGSDSEGDQARQMSDVTPPGSLQQGQGTVRSPQEGETVNRVNSTGRVPGRGAAEAALTIGTSSLAEPIAGMGGVFEGIASFVAGEEDPAMQAADTVRNLREAMTFQPRTQQGQEAMSAVGQLFEPLARGAQQAGEAVQDVTGSAAAGAATRSAVELAPGAVGVRPGTMRAGMAARRRGRDIERSTGVDLDAGPGRQGQQVAQSLEQQTGGRRARGEGFESIQQAVAEAKQQTKAEVDRLYQEARNTRAGLPTVRARRFPQLAKQALRDFDVQDLPTVRRRMSELQRLEDIPDDSTVKLNAFADFRQRINQNKGSSDTEQAANAVLKGQLDSFLEAEFNSDMISGNPAAIDKWKRARGAHRAYAEQFKDMKTIRQLAGQEATPEEVRRWVTGSSSVGGSKQAGQVVSRLKGILGEDSPEFAAIRQDFIMDVAEPLLQADPEDISLKRFRQNYDRAVRNRPTLAKELLGNGYNDLRNLRDLVEGMRSASSPNIQFNINKSLAQGIFGHQLAKGELRRRVGQAGIELLRSAVSKSRRRQILGEITGYDPSTSVFQRTPLAAAAGTQAGIQASEGRSQPAAETQQQQPPQQPAGTPITPPASAGRRQQQR